MKRIISIIIIAIIGFLLITGVAYLKIEKELLKIKGDFISVVENRTGFLLSINKISPLFFRGVKLENVIVYTKDKSELLKIDDIKIYIRLKDILFKKIKPEESIYQIDINNYKLTINEALKNRFKNIKTLLSKNRDNTSSLKIENIYGNGKIHYISRNLRLTIINPDFRLKLPEAETEFEFYLLPEKIYNYSTYNLSCYVEGKGTFGAKTNTVKLKINNFNFKNQEIEKEIYLNCIYANNKISFYAKDKSGSFYSTGNIKKNFLRLTAKFHNFDWNYYKISGKFSFRKRDISRYNVALSIINRIKKFKYEIKISKKSDKTEIERFVIKRTPQKFVKLTGWIINQKKFFLKLWFNNYTFKNYNLLGKIVLFPAYGINRFKLINFYINRYKIKELTGELYSKNHKIFVNIIKNTENFLLNSVIEKNLFTFNIKLNDISLANINKIIEKTLIPETISKGNITGNIKAQIRKKRITSLTTTLLLKFKENPQFKKIYVKTGYNNRQGKYRIKILLPDNNHIIFKGTTHLSSDTKKITFNSLLITPATEIKSRGTIIEQTKKYRITLFINKFGKLSGTISKSGKIFFKAKLNKKFKNQYISSVETILNFHTYINELKNFKLSGRLSIAGRSPDNSLTLDIDTKHRKILFKNIKMRYKNLKFKGSGFYNSKTENVLINLGKIKITGKFSLDNADVYLVLRNIKNIQYSPSIRLSINGFIRYKSNFIDEKYLYSDLNFYKISIGKFNIDEAYLIYRIRNNNIEIKKSNFELYGGKIKTYDTEIYKKDGNTYISSLWKISDVKYNNLLFRGKIYTKIKFSDKVYIKLKIIKLFVNELKLKDIAQEIYLTKDSIRIKRLTDDGIKGNIVIKKSSPVFKLKIFKDNQYLSLIEGKVSKNYIDTHLNIKSLNLSFLEEISDFIKSADGNIKADIKIQGKRDSPELTGFIKGNNIKLRCNTILKRIDSLEFDISANEGRISVNKLKGRIGKGWFRSFGTIDLNGLVPGEWDLFLETLDEKGIYIAKAEDDLMGNIKGKVKITGNLGQLHIAGKVILQDFDFTWPLSSSESSEISSPVKKIDLDVDIIAGKNVVFFQDQNNIEILVKEGGKFHIRGDMSAEHKVVGRMEAEKGEIEYFGTPFNIVYATVSFADAYEENVPWISAKAEATVKDSNNEDITITMIVEGRAYNDLAPTLISSPALTKREIFFLLNDSTLYVSEKSTTRGEVIHQSEKEIEELIKIGFVQIFDTTYRNKLVAPLQRKAKRFLGLDILSIKSSLIQNLLAPKIVNLRDETSVENEKSILAGTQITVGKYLTDNLLLKYSVALKESDTELNRLYYEHQFGIEMNILKSLKFEWKYTPLYMYQTEEPVPEIEYILKWKKKVSF